MKKLEELMELFERAKKYPNSEAHLKNFFDAFPALYNEMRVMEKKLELAINELNASCNTCFFPEKMKQGKCIEDCPTCLDNKYHNEALVELGIKEDPNGY